MFFATIHKLLINARQSKKKQPKFTIVSNDCRMVTFSEKLKILMHKKVKLK